MRDFKTKGHAVESHKGIASGCPKGEDVLCCRWQSYKMELTKLFGAQIPTEALDVKYGAKRWLACPNVFQSSFRFTLPMMPVFSLGLEIFIW